MSPADEVDAQVETWKVEGKQQGGKWTLGRETWNVEASLGGWKRGRWKVEMSYLDIFADAAVEWGMASEVTFPVEFVPRTDFLTDVASVDPCTHLGAEVDRDFAL